MKKLSFFLMAMLVSLTSFAAALGDGYSKVTDITTLSAGDKVVLYCDDAELGVTGWNGSKDATVAAEGWVEYVVEAAEGGVLLKDGEQYISLTAKNSFKYAAEGSVCKVTAAGVLYCTFSEKDYLLYQNNGEDGPFYRMYTDKAGTSYESDYKPFYVYKVAAIVEPEIEWIPMELEIANLVTEVMEVEGAKYLRLQGRDDMNDADVMLFLNNYADVDDDYEVNAENS